MANRSVLPELVSRVQAFFAAEGITTKVFLGFKEAARTDNATMGSAGADRIVFDMRGAKEKVLPPKGGNVRAMKDGNRSRVLWTVQWSIPVQFWAADRGVAGDPENDNAQIEAYVTMFEHAAQAVHAYLRGAYQWADGDQPDQPTERTFGRAWTKTLLVLEDIYDVENGVALPGPGVISKDFERVIG